MAVSGPRGVRARALVSTGGALAALALLGSTLAASAQPAGGPAATGGPTRAGSGEDDHADPDPKIAQRAEQATTLLRSAQAPEGSEFRDAELELTGAADWIDKRSVNTTETLVSSHSASALANLADAWQAMRSRLFGQRQVLTRRATLAQQRVQEIETMRAAWAATRGSAGEAAAPSTVLEQIDAAMAVIAGARRNADDGLARVLALQDRTVKEIALGDQVLARIGEDRERAGRASGGARHAAESRAPQAAR